MFPVQYNPFLSYDTGFPDKHLIMTGDRFEWMINFLRDSPGITFDFETSGVRWFDKAEACGIALAGWADNQVHHFYVPFRHYTGEPQLDLSAIGKPIGDLLGDESKIKIAHNIKFDEHFAIKEGWPVRGLRYDTMIAATLFNENRRLALEKVVAKDLGIHDSFQWKKKMDHEVARLVKASGKKKKKYLLDHGYSQVNIPLCGTYSCFDADYATKLYFFFESRGVSQRYQRLWHTEMVLTEALCAMEEMGLPINVDYLLELRRTLSKIKAEKEVKIVELSGKHFNVGSDDELRSFLMRDLGFRLTKRTKKKQLAVDKDVLSSFEDAHPVIPHILEWREVEKLLNTYTSSILERIDSKNILHCDFQQVGTVTGRLSCKEPNFQNQPSDSDFRAREFSGKSLEDGGVDPWSIRRAYANRGKEWVRLFFDYSQIELRVLAYYSKDPIMVDAYLKGEDIHSRTSQEVFGTKEKAQRRKAKVINFGLSYGMTEKGFSNQAKISLEEATRYLSIFFQRYKGISSFRDSFYQYIRSNRCQFQNLFGRPRRLPAMASFHGWERGRAERQAIATIIQGTAAELTKESIVRIWEYLQSEKIPAYLVNTVHDEIQIDCAVEVMPEVCRKVKKLMEDFPEFSPIPIVVDGDYTTESWADKKGLPL